MPDEEKVVEAEVIKPPAAEKSFFHPLSGAVILGLDWLAFGSEAVTGFLAVALTSMTVAILTYSAVQAIQLRRHGDSPERARLKAIIGAIAAGIPFPITGTFLGTAILLLSGLKRLTK